ncbi:uncharacterized protein LOC143035023 [Oratosquilla oratoria]|uniref:uncharacterized protein LOC143035023 n=1 Tax=Oratosquilla oratoria TaxID=337810 RepID=UPI003F758657
MGVQSPVFKRLQYEQPKSQQQQQQQQQTTPKSTSPAPPRLESLALESVRVLVTGVVRRRRWEEKRDALRNAIHKVLPHNLRQALQDVVLRDWRVYDLLTLRVLDLLLSGSTRSLRVTQVRTFYQDDFVQLLGRLVGLQELVLQDFGLTLTGRKLTLTASALSRMEHLRVLTLQYCAHDLLLAAVGRQCHVLQVLDVRGSRNVTDAGAQALVSSSRGASPAVTPSSTQAPSVLTSPGKNQLSLRPKSFWGVAVKSFALKLVLDHRTTRTLFRSKSCYDVMSKDENQQELQQDQHYRHHSLLLQQWRSPRQQRQQNQVLQQQMLQQQKLQLEQQRKFSGCCSSLVVLDLRCTLLTLKGLRTLQAALRPEAKVFHSVKTKF